MVVCILRQYLYSRLSEKKIRYFCLPTVLVPVFFEKLINQLLFVFQKVKHSKIADQLESALESKKYLQTGMDSDQVHDSIILCIEKNIVHKLHCCIIDKCL